MIIIIIIIVIIVIIIPLHYIILQYLIVPDVYHIMSTCLPLKAAIDALARIVAEPHQTAREALIKASRVVQPSLSHNVLWSFDRR